MGDKFVNNQEEESKSFRKRNNKRFSEERLDDIDLKILEILQNNARISMKDLGAAVSLTSPAVSERVKRLEMTGIISGYTAIINPEALGRSIKAYINISVYSGDFSSFITKAKDDSRIVECHHITGEDSLLLKVIVSSMYELENIIERVKDIGTTKTSVILSTPIQAKSIL